MKHIDAGGSSHGAGQQPVQSVTSAPQSIADEQGVRMRRYLIAMSFRGICFVLAIITTGWVRWAFVVGAVVLPYIAVVLANAVGPRFGDTVAPVRPHTETRPALTGTIDDAHPLAERRNEHAHPPYDA